MIIPFVDIYAQYKNIQSEIDNAIKEVIEKSSFVGGNYVRAFENEFSQYLKARYCIGVNSGTDALILGIRALRYPGGDEIIVPANTFIATALGVSENRLKPVFVDCDENDYGINIKDLKNKISKKTKAIIVVHLYGQPDKIDEIKHVIRESGYTIDLIEDACQAHGALYKGKRVGTFGIFSAFSFYPGKNLGAYGDGGAVVTMEKRMDTACRLLREYGQKKKYIHREVGINSRLDGLQAAILSVKLRYVDAWNKKRQHIAHHYTTLLKKHFPFIICPSFSQNRASVYHLYPIRVPRRNSLEQYLKKKGIQALIHYPIPLHLQKAYTYLGYKRGDFPIAEKIAGQLVSLPIYPELTPNAIEYVVQSMKEFYETK